MTFPLFHFLRPYWLLLLPLLIMLLWLMIKRRLGSRSWEAICDRHLLPYMLIGGSSRSRRTPIILVGICGLMAILSLAGPVWKKLPQPVFSNQLALVIALDLSRSMDANDVSPSRLTRARFKIADILNQHQEGQVALLVYAADAFTVTPLTDDMATIESQLSALGTNIMPGQGNRTDLALDKAEELLKGAGHRGGDILLVTDEIDLPRVESRARQLRQAGYQISVLGIGTDHGAPVVLEDGSFLKDSRGDIVIPTLHEKPMRQLAQLGGGDYRLMTLDDNDIKFLLGRFSQHAGKHQGGTSKFETDVWQEQGPWLLLLLAPLAALAFRRGYLIVLIIMLMPVPDTVHAFDWGSLWLRADQRARRELDAGNPRAAAELFKDPAWKSAAQYRAGDFKATVKSLEGTEDVEGLYNKGNALARLGRYQEAIAAYDKVLKHMPAHEDARHNRELVEKELKKQQQQKRQNGKQQQDKKNQRDQQQKKKGKNNRDNQRQQGQKSRDGQQQGEQSTQPEKQKQKNREGGAKKPGNKSRNNPARQAQQQKPEQPAEAKSAPARRERQQSAEKAGDQKQGVADAVNTGKTEKQQATEQWLRRIPDDPAGLLRRKFLYQYKQRARQQGAEEKTW